MPTLDGMKPTSRKPEAVKVGSVSVKIYSRLRLHKKVGKTYRVYEVADYSSGVRRLRSFNDHTEARKEAERIARQLSSGEATAALLRNSEAASYGRALELLRPTGTALEVATAHYAKAVEILGGDAVIEAARFYAHHRADQVTRKQVSEVVGELIAAKQSRNKSPRYIADLRWRLNHFAKAFAVDIGSITTADVQRWLDNLKVAAQTAKNGRTVLYTLFSFAESRGYIFKGGNPVEGTESITADNGGKIEILTPAEISALLKSASPEFLPIVALGAFAGLRTAEIQRIEWEDIDLSGGWIHVGSDKAKTRSRRLVPILPNLAQWLAPYAKRSGKVWKETVTTWHHQRAATVEASGVAWKPNALRHSFCSYRLADIQNAAQVSLEAGNSPNVIFKHYRELVKPSEAKAWFSISPESPANLLSLSVA